MKKKIRNLKEVNPATLMENFHQSDLNQNTNISEAYNQLTLQLQEMLDKCVPEKIVKRKERPHNPWFIHTLHEQWKIAKTEKEPGINISSSIIGMHIQWKEIDMSVNSITLKNNQLVRESWTARRTPKNSSA